MRRNKPSLGTSCAGRACQVHRSCHPCHRASVARGASQKSSTAPACCPHCNPNNTSPPKYPSPWGTGLGNWSEAYAQARAFVAQLTLTEKVNLTTGVGWEGEKCVGNNGAIPRLAFKAMCMEDSPLGVRNTDFNSAFPAGVTIAATWDRALFYQRGFGMGSEHRDKGVDVQLGPVVGPIGRSPEGGRNWEGFSPDPVLSGIGVFETVQGIQAAGVMACTKHYIGNEQEHFRQGSPPASLGGNAISSNIDDITMHELYLWPFADAIRAGTASIMCSYNMINNSFACQNSYIQNYLLKDELGFQGFIMSDWSAQHSGVSSALAGLDQTMPGDEGFDSGNSYWGANLTIAVLNGTVPQWRLDDMCVRIMAAWYYVDRENNQVPDAPNFSAWTTDTFGYQHFYAREAYTQINWHVDVRDNHAQEIRAQAAAGTVVLMNKGSLPLTGKEKLTAVFGSDASENQYGPNGCPDRGCDMGTLAMGWGSGTANFPYLVTPLEAIKAQVLSNGGAIEDVIDDYAYGQMTGLARRVTQVGGACIAFGNADAGEGYITVDNNEGDRNNLTAWHNFDSLVANVTSQCNNTIIVLHTVGPVLVDAWYQNPNVTAIVWAGIPGQESGNSITDILYGKVNPSGKTPFTWGNSRGSYGTDLLYQPNNGNLAPQDNFEEGVFIDYRFFDKTGETPIFEFGLGLSYTTFSYSNLRVTAVAAPAYTAPGGNTGAAPTFGTVSSNAADYVFPAGFHQVPYYIYPFLNSTSLRGSSMDPQYAINYTFPAGGYNSSAQPYLPAGGAPGGNPLLYSTLFTISATITNTGRVAGAEVPQLYLSLGGPNDPKVVLRNFDKLTIQPGASATFTANITRKDLSNWSPALQDWYISCSPKTAYVGSSSRKLPLSASLDVSSFCSGSGTGPLGPSGSSSSSGIPSTTSSRSSTMSTSYANSTTSRSSTSPSSSASGVTSNSPPVSSTTPTTSGSPSVSSTTPASSTRPASSTTPSGSASPSGSSTTSASGSTAAPVSGSPSSSPSTSRPTTTASVSPSSSSPASASPSSSPASPSVSVSPTTGPTSPSASPSSTVPASPSTMSTTVSASATVPSGWTVTVIDQVTTTVPCETNTWAYSSHGWA
ncbi:glycoside hydrolase family 3 protein [Baudoinia panamericana UAMH 10762]|uniref:beta-glucosidase n=1 Tax=Baudoinia panamericana (strain UAMH 10762) TaxID=717646 RepID=M2M208_BAUPA|nr:glycoside hydrolase family 3 protein [Baudoinia panamericana UAMH 10762]EMD01113.1 glycoside hydrolase family 3 protein [Baudoinia panamericana UAMH 10762]